MLPAFATELGYIPDLQAVPSGILKRARLLWLNYPIIPPAAASLDFFTRAVEFARQNRLILCHDAAYTQVCFDGYRAPSLEVPGAKEVCVSSIRCQNRITWPVGGWLPSLNPADQSLHSLKTNIDSGHFRPVMERRWLR
jgi:LL-diaminopimelate aminotransferase